MSNESAGKAKLFAKVAKVMTAIRTLPKDGENKFDKYNYITGDAVFERIGKAMSDANLITLPSIIDLTTTVGESGSGKPMLRTVIHGQITLADGETGESWTSDWYGEGADRGDKSINKAMTAMMKYYLLRLFNVGSGEDADEESPEAPANKQAQKPAQQAAQRQAPVTQPTPSHRQPEATAVASNGNGATPKALAIPKTFTDAGAAIKWGYDVGAFAAYQHSENAYNKLKEEKKPATATDMFKLWTEDVQRRLAEKQSTVA